MKRGRKLVYFFLVIAIMAGLLELGSRMLLRKYDNGYHCFEITKTLPESPIIADNKYGYFLKDGTYSFANECQLVFGATHVNHERTANPNDTSKNKKTVLVFGDSNIYGYGVEDTCTLPFYLQQFSPQYQVHNMGVPGWSALISYLRLRDYLNDSTKPVPALIVFQLASYDGGRITLTPLFLDAYKSQKIEGRTFDLPYAYLANDSMFIGKKTIKNSPYDLADISAFVNVVSRLYLIRVSFNDEAVNNGNKVTKALFKQIQKVCAEHKVKLLIAGNNLKEKDEAFYSINYNLPQEGIYFTNLNNKDTSSSYTLLPYDSHPSAKGHLFYAKQLFQKIETDTLLP